MPYQFDYQMRVPWPNQPDGYYYWTNAWIVNATTDAQSNTRLTQIDTAVDGMTLNATQQVRVQRKRSPGMGGVYSNTTLFNDPGSLPTGTSGYNLLWYALVRLYVGTEQVGYKRWRAPWRYSDMAGPLWVPGVTTTLSTRFGTLIGLGALAARDGRVIDGFQVDPFIRQWQLRHGTKRRERVVVA